MSQVPFEHRTSTQGFTVKLWRGERMCLIGFDVANPEPDLVGFAIECKEPGGHDFHPLLNRLAFSYPTPAATAVTGKRKFSSLLNPFQKFRWVHFPFEPRAGKYTYRATKMHMPADAPPVKGQSVTLDISLDPVTHDGFLDVGFTRGFAASQAFLDKFPAGTNFDVIGPQIIPSPAATGLTFHKLTHPADLYQWMGFEARDLLFRLLDEAVNDPNTTLDMFTYDFNEPDILSRLQALGSRLRIIMDDSDDHKAPTTAESQAATALTASAGAAHVKRAHFGSLQHNKVLILKRAGTAAKVLCGSCNHSFRGLYIQSNNVLVFDQPDIAGLFASYFEAAFKTTSGFGSNPLAAKWHLVHAPGRPPVHIAFSPHQQADLSLNPLRAAIDQAQDSVFYNIAFLNQIKEGPTLDAIARLMQRQIFSYGVSDKAGSMALQKPDGSIGQVDFAFLAKNAPQPFRAEWSGQQGINVHHKFVVTDFNRPSAKVFTGSSNLAVSGEQGNGDHLIIIEDRKVALSYAVEALRIFDHLHFRDVMKKGTTKPTVITLMKPTAISGKPTWFAEYYVPNTQKQKDRELFAT